MKGPLTLHTDPIHVSFSVSVHIWAQQRQRSQSLGWGRGGVFYLLDLCIRGVFYLLKPFCAVYQSYILLPALGSVLKWGWVRYSPKKWCVCVFCLQGSGKGRGCILPVATGQFGPKIKPSLMIACFVSFRCRNGAALERWQKYWTGARTGGGSDAADKTTTMKSVARGNGDEALYELQDLPDLICANISLFCWFFRRINNRNL